MSHVIASKVYVAELQDARIVGDRLGFDLVLNDPNFAWYGSWQNDYRGADAAVTNGYDPKTFGTCEHKLRRKDHVPGMYEIGLVRRADGKPGWELVYDNWGYTAHREGKAIEEKAGVGLCKFKAGLAEHGFRAGLQRQNYRMTRTVNERGQIILQAVR